MNAEYRIKHARLYLFGIENLLYSSDLNSFNDVLFTLVNLYYSHSRLFILTFTKILIKNELKNSRDSRERLPSGAEVIDFAMIMYFARKPRNS